MDGPRHEEHERPINATVPEWAKFAATIIVTMGAMFTWASGTFVSRIEYQAHQDSQRQDIERLARIQADYATAERGTSQNLGDISERLGTIETDLSWVRSYLDLSKPAPRRPVNGSGRPK